MVSNSFAKGDAYYWCIVSYFLGKAEIKAFSCDQIPRKSKT